MMLIAGLHWKVTEIIRSDIFETLPIEFIRCFLTSILMPQFPLLLAEEQYKVNSGFNVTFYLQSMFLDSCYVKNIFTIAFYKLVKLSSAFYSSYIICRCSK